MTDHAFVVEGGRAPLEPMVPVLNANGERQEVQRGTVITDQEGQAYVVDRLVNRPVLVQGTVRQVAGMTLRRQIPKVKGKAAKKAAKRARHARLEER